MPVLFDKTNIAELSADKKIRLVVDGLEDEELWLLDIAGSVTPNYQILYSLGATAFVNAFNNRLGKFTISGIYIPSACEEKGGTSNSSDESSDDTPPFIEFYKKIQITQKESATMAYNGISIIGWAVQLDIKKYSQNNIDGHAFTISFLGRIRELD
jgi:hypothetical protein